MLTEQKLRELREEFEASKELQVEFGRDTEAYLAFHRHEAELKEQDERRARRKAAKPGNARI